MSPVYHGIQVSVTQLPLFTFSRVCTSCHTEKDLDQFYKRPKHSAGYSTQCKACETERDRQRQQRYILNRPPLPHSKICPRCNNEYPLEEFPLDRSKKDGHYCYCVLCTVEERRTYRATHQQELQAYEQRRKGDPKRRAQDNDYHRRRSTLPEYQEKAKERQRRWTQANPEKLTEKSLRRRARLREARVEKVDYRYIRQQSTGLCYICQQPILPHHRTEFDHIIPITRGGSHTMDNIALVHRTCNRRKKDFLLEEMDSYLRRGVK